METRKELRAQKHLVCENHADSRAEQVCGKCGKPICTDCATTFTDVTLNDYRTGGIRRIVVGGGFVIAGLFLVDAIPRVLWRTLSNMAGKPLYIPGGLKPALILIGVAMFASVRYRSMKQGFDLDNFQFLTRQAHERTFCNDCWQERGGLQYYFAWALLLIAVAFILFGLYRSFSGLFFHHLDKVGLGIAIYIIRDEILTLLFGILE